MTLTARPSYSSLGFVRGYLLDVVFPAALPGVEAFYGHPGKEFPTRFVACTTQSGIEVTQQWEGQPYSRPYSVGESFEVGVFLWSEIGDQDPASQRVVTEDVFGMFDSLATYLRANPGLGSDDAGVVLAAPCNARVARYVQRDVYLHEGRAADIFVSLSVETRV